MSDDETRKQSPIDAAAKMQPTSDKGETKKPEVQKVIQGQAKERKTPFIERVKNVFITGDFTGAVKYVGAEVLLPALRNLLVDSLTMGIERTVYGVDPRRRGPRPSMDHRPRYRYDAPVTPRRGYVPDQPLPPGTRRPDPRRSYDINEIIIPSKDEAELVLERMGDILSQYEVVSVADLKELCGLSTNYVDNTWGWTSLAYSNVQQVREGFLLNLPPAEAL